jgi:hypothetical protein
LKKFSSISKAYLNKANKEITKGFKPIVSSTPHGRYGVAKPPHGLGRWSGHPKKQTQFFFFLLAFLGVVEPLQRPWGWFFHPRTTPIPAMEVALATPLAGHPILAMALFFFFFSTFLFY